MARQIPNSLRKRLYDLYGHGDLCCAECRETGHLDSAIKVLDAEDLEK